MSRKLLPLLRTSGALRLLYGLIGVGFHLAIYVGQFSQRQSHVGWTPRVWLKQPRLRRAYLSLILAAFGLVAGVSLLLSHASSGRLDWLPFASKPKLPGLILEPDGPGFYDWQILSSFSPVGHEDVDSKSIEEICKAFPSHLLGHIQPVLKTGHKMLQDRVRPQLRSASACLSNLLIFSDTEEEFDDRSIVNIIAEIPQSLTNRARTLKAWRSGAISKNAASYEQGWNADKFKFMPAVSQAWRMRPNMQWYVFFEDDTYIIWDNVFRYLEKFDPDESYYFGSPTPGDEQTWFANGGPGYILSREAMRRFVQKDWDPQTGNYLGPKLTGEYWDELADDCCGDASLGRALWHQNVTIRGLFPMFSPIPPDAVSFSDRQWCQPILSLHLDGKMEHASSLWRWEWENRRSDRPLLYRDLAMSYFKFRSLSPRDNWNNGEVDAFLAPYTQDATNIDPHESQDACDQACKAHKGCFQWTYHLRQCYFVRYIRFGRHTEPGFTTTERKRRWFYTWGWDKTDIQFRAGWDVEKIAQWIGERSCDPVRWVKPSTKRIY